MSEVVENVVNQAKTTRKKAEAAVESAMAEMKEKMDTTTLEQFLEHQRNALSEAGKALESLVPTAFREHGQSAVKEMVEGYRQLVNKTLDTVMETVERLKLENGKDEKK